MTMFNKIILDLELNLFEQLLRSVEFENITQGRKGANLIDNRNELIPLIRTTTSYKKPNQKFIDIHYNLINQIKEVYHNYLNKLEFNSALIEIYDSQYKNMKYHSDQATDLAHDSFICVYSCYSNPNTKQIRELCVKNKLTDESSNISMEHNSIITFSVETNKKHLHKIILDDHNICSNDLWLGITFRFSKTFIQFRDEIPYFVNHNRKLLLANDIQKKEFYKYRSCENNNVEYVYPDMDYTISVGDLIPIN